MKRFWIIYSVIGGISNVFIALYIYFDKEIHIFKDIFDTSFFWDIKEFWFEQWAGQLWGFLLTYRIFGDSLFTLFLSGVCIGIGFLILSILKRIDILLPTHFVLSLVHILFVFFLFFSGELGDRFILATFFISFFIHLFILFFSLYFLNTVVKTTPFKARLSVATQFW